MCKAPNGYVWPQSIQYGSRELGIAEARYAKAIFAKVKSADANLAESHFAKAKFAKGRSAEAKLAATCPKAKFAKGTSAKAKLANLTALTDPQIAGLTKLCKSLSQGLAGKTWLLLFIMTVCSRYLLHPLPTFPIGPIAEPWHSPYE